jgi:hypothetical protein
MTRHVERQRNISFLEAFSILRSFAYAQDDATEMCGTGKAEREGEKQLSGCLVVRLSEITTP